MFYLLTAVHIRGQPQTTLLYIYLIIIFQIEMHDLLIIDFIN